MWEPNSQRFLVKDQILVIDVDDIYFLTRLSRRGESMEFSGRGGGEESVDSYVSKLFMVGSHKQGGNLPSQHMSEIPLKPILYIVTCIARSPSAHLASKSQF